MKCIQKVSRQKMYLGREKWTINGTLPFSKERDVFKKFRDIRRILQDKDEKLKKMH